MGQRIGTAEEFQNLVRESNLPRLIIFYNNESDNQRREIYEEIARDEYPDIDAFRVNLDDNVMTPDEQGVYVQDDLICCTGINSRGDIQCESNPDSVVFDRLMDWIRVKSTMVQRISTKDEFQNRVVNSNLPRLVIFYDNQSHDQRREIYEEIARDGYPDIAAFRVNLDDQVLSPDEQMLYVLDDLICCTGINSRGEIQCESNPDLVGFRLLMEWIESN